MVMSSQSPVRGESVHQSRRRTLYRKEKQARSRHSNTEALRCCCDGGASHAGAATAVAMVERRTLAVSFLLTSVSPGDFESERRAKPLDLTLICSQISIQHKHWLSLPLSVARTQCCSPLKRYSAILYSSRPEKLCSMGTRGMTRVVSDMDEHSKVKADAKVIVKEAYDSVGSKDDKVIAGFIKVRGGSTISFELPCRYALRVHSAEEVRRAIWSDVALHCR
jgi:hypothetical protein